MESTRLACIHVGIGVLGFASWNRMMDILRRRGRSSEVSLFTRVLDSPSAGSKISIGDYVRMYDTSDDRKSMDDGAEGKKNV